MRMLASLLILLSLNSALGSERLIVAVIDTGLDITDSRFKGVLCEFGHKDFTGTGLRDTVGHGTHIVGLIKKYAGDSPYCVVILKFYDRLEDGYEMSYYMEAMKYLSTTKFFGVDIANLSLNGLASYSLEYELMRANKQIHYVVAAGNDNINLDELCTYPACYAKTLRNVTAVAATNARNKKAQSSNYGSFVKWEQGVNILSTIPGGEGVMTGTSQATAIFTGKLIYETTH